MIRRYAYFIIPTSNCSVAEAETRLAEHSHVYDTCARCAVETSKALGDDGIYFDTMGTREDPLVDAHLVPADFEAGAKKFGVIVRFVTVGENLTS